MEIDYKAFFLVSYCIGWMLIALRAKYKGVIDLCQFLRAFLFGPLILGGIIIFVIGVAPAVAANIGTILFTISLTVGGIVSVWASGRYVIKPVVTKAYGEAVALSDKICIVLYKKQR